MLNGGNPVDCGCIGEDCITIELPSFELKDNPA
jgi:hypothetical protein